MDQCDARPPSAAELVAELVKKAFGLRNRLAILNNFLATTPARGDGDRPPAECFIGDLVTASQIMTVALDELQMIEMKLGADRLPEKFSSSPEVPVHQQPKEFRPVRNVR